MATERVKSSSDINGSMATHERTEIKVKVTDEMLPGKQEDELLSSLFAV